MAVKDGGGGLDGAKGLAQREIFVNGGVESAALHKRAEFGHFRSGENGGDGAVHVAILFPLLLIHEKSLLHGLNLAELRGRASIARGDPRMRGHGGLEIAWDQIDFAAANVVFPKAGREPGEHRTSSRA